MCRLWPSSSVPWTSAAGWPAVGRAVPRLCTLCSRSTPSWAVAPPESAAGEPALSHRSALPDCALSRPHCALLCPHCALPTPCSLEGDEFETDEENLAAWQELFRQRHYWAAEVGPATFIGLSTVRFRRCVCVWSSGLAPGAGLKVLHRWGYMLPCCSGCGAVYPGLPSNASAPCTSLYLTGSRSPA